MNKNDLSFYTRLAGLSEREVVTESADEGKKDKKEDTSSNLTEAEKVAFKQEKKERKVKEGAVRTVARGNKRATQIGETVRDVAKKAAKRYGSKKMGKCVAEAILWKKLSETKVTFTEEEIERYFKEFDGIVKKALTEVVVDTGMGAKSLHKQYDPTIDGNVYKDSEKEAAKAGKGPAYKKDDKWKNYNEKARDKALDDTNNPKGGELGDRSPVPGQDAAFVDGNQHPSTQAKEGMEYEEEGKKKAVAAMGKSPAAAKAKESVMKKSGYGTKEGLDLDFFRKVAGIKKEADQDETHYVVTEASTGKIECIFPNQLDAKKWIDKMKKAAGTYNCDPKTFARGFHFKTDTNGGYTNEAK